MADVSFFEKLSNFMEQKFMPVASKFANQRHLKAIKDGIITSIPLTIVGGFSLILANPPIDPEKTLPTNVLKRFLLSWYHWAEKYSVQITTPFKMTMAIMAIFICMAIAYNLAKHYKMNSLSSAIVAGVTFLMVTAPTTKAVLLSDISDGMDIEGIKELGQGVMPTSFLDAKGLFVAILVGLLSVEITRLLKSRGIVIKMPEGVPPAVAASFESITPLVANILVFYSLSLILQSKFSLTLPEAILKGMSPAMTMMDSAGAVFVASTIVQLFWFIGIHGSAATNGIFMPFEEGNLMMNAGQKMAGQEMTQVFATPFWDFFIVIGGCGATLALVFLFLRSKSKHLKEVGKVALLPAIFNINEPIIFGAPLVLNPVLAIPFIFAQGINGLIAFYLTKFGVIGKTFIRPPWTAPAPIGAFLATLDWKAAVLVLILIALDAVIYYPFFKMYERQLIKEQGE